MKPRTVIVKNRMYSATTLLREFDPRGLHALLSMPVLIYECCRA